MSQELNGAQGTEEIATTAPSVAAQRPPVHDVRVKQQFTKCIRWRPFVC
jgi:hypothetical protein